MMAVKAGTLPDVVARAAKSRDWLQSVYDRLKTAVAAQTQGTVVRMVPCIDVAAVRGDLTEVLAAVRLESLSNEVVDTVRVPVWMFMPDEELNPILAHIASQAHKQMLECEGTLEELSRLIPAWGEMENATR